LKSSDNLKKLWKKLLGTGSRLRSSFPTTPVKITLFRVLRGIISSKALHVAHVIAGIPRGIKTKYLLINLLSIFRAAVCDLPLR
jgi:hypothetical protein